MKTADEAKAGCDVWLELEVNHLGSTSSASSVEHCEFAPNLDMIDT